MSKRLSLTTVLGMLALAAAMSPALAQNSNAGRGTQGGDPPPDPNPPKDPEIETRSGNSGSTCTYESDGNPPGGPVDLGTYGGCVTSGGTSGGYETTIAPVDNPGPHPTGLASLFHYETTYDDGPPADMCICENDHDMTYLSVQLPGTGHAAKIRKFTVGHSSGTGTVTIYVNTTPVSFSTDPGLNLETLNQRMVNALTGAGVNVTDAGDYLVIWSAGKQAPINRVGFHCTDPALTRSEVSIEPANFANSLACSPGSSVCGN